MTKKGREFNEIYDLTAMRVIVGSVKDCYGAIGIIHSIWKPLPGRFKDFIATPKLNLYQALHTTVIGPEGRPLEIQIRTAGHARDGRVRDRRARDLQGGRRPPARPTSAREKMTWLRQLLDQEGDEDATEFLEPLKVDLFEDEVFVFTPKGEVKNLSAGSTPLDFAYAVHTDVGHRCVGAKVNGKIVPLHYTLQSGDIVEILTAKQERGPSRDWLALVRTSRARNKIRAFLKRERREDAERRGREQLQTALRKRGLPPQRIAGSPLLADVTREMGFRKADDFYIALGQGKISREDGRQQGHAAAQAGRGRRRRRDRVAARRGARGPRRAPAPHPGRVRLRDQGRGRRRRRWSAWPSAAGRSRATRSSATSRSGAGSRSTARTAATSSALMKSPERFTDVAWAGDNAHLLPSRAPGRCLGPHPPARGPLADLLRGRREHPRGQLLDQAPDGPEPVRGRGRRLATAQAVRQPAAGARRGVRRLSGHAH